MSNFSSWIFLVIAGLLEICWAIGLKYSHGFSKLIPTIFTALTLALSMYFLARASQNLPIGTAYAIWVGIGALGAAVLGIFLFNESISSARIFFLALLMISIIGLKFTADS